MSSQSRPYQEPDFLPWDGRRVPVTFLGTAGFVIRAAQRTFVLDPFLSRPGLLTTAFGRLLPDGQRHVG